MSPPQVLDGDLSDAAKADIIAITKKPSTKHLVMMWQVVIVGLHTAIPHTLVHLLGPDAGAKAWAAMDMIATEHFGGVRRKYGVLTCAQACFKPLNANAGLGARSQMVANARDAASALDMSLPGKLHVIMQQLSPSAPAVATAQAKGQGEAPAPTIAPSEAASLAAAQAAQ